MNSKHQRIYVECMADLEMGTPLYEPDPGRGRSGPPIGDVGYINRSGKFMSIFNVFSATTTAKGVTSRVVDPGHPVAREVEIAGIPLTKIEDEECTGLTEGHPYTSNHVHQIRTGIDTG